MPRSTFSLRYRLIGALAAMVLIVALVAAAGASHRALTEAREAQDALLARVSQIVQIPGAKFSPGNLADTANQSGLVIERLAVGKPAATIPVTTPDGLSTVDTTQGPQRVLVSEDSAGTRLAVAQPIAVRQDAVNETLLTTLTPIILGAPLLIFVAWLVVSWALKPLSSLRHELEARSDGSLAPLPQTKVPAELAVFLDALEAHHQRAAQALEGQRQFAAQAAHELRTPVAAVSFQAEHLLAANTAAQSQQRQLVLREGLARLRELCDQLLVLGDESVQAEQLVEFENIALLVAGDIIEADPHAGPNIEWDLGDGGKVMIPAVGTRVVLQNLVSNAVRYAATSGPIAVRAAKDGHWLRVEVIDAGPGIKDPVRVLDAFHREANQDIPGTGLGLAITVRTLERMGGWLDLLARVDQPGTVARFRVPFGETGPHSRGTGF